MLLYVFLGRNGNCALQTQKVADTQMVKTISYEHVTYFVYELLLTWCLLCMFHKKASYVCRYVIKNITHMSYTTEKLQCHARTICVLHVFLFINKNTIHIHKDELRYGS